MTDQSHDDGPPEQRPTDPYAQPPNAGQASPSYGQQPPPYGQPPAFDPAAAGYGQPIPPPKPILNAVKLMFVGAALAALTTLLTLVFLDRDALINDAVEQADISRGDAEAAVNAFVNGSIIIGVISIALWIWMAFMNRKGRLWARVTATVLGGLNIIFILFSFTQPSSGLNIAFNLVSVALAATILYLLYRPESTEYYEAQSRRP